MKKLVKTALCGMLALGITAISPAPASAQDGSGELGIGYQYINFGDFDLSYPLGFNVDYAYPLSNFPLSIIGEFGWSRHSDDPFTSTLLNFGAGVRYDIALDAGIQPYVQVVFGAQRDSDELDGEEVFSGSNFMWQPGGGVALPLNDMWDLFGQIDFRSVSYEDESAWGSPRIVVGGRVGL